MSATSKIPSMPNVAFLGLLIFLCLYPGVGTAEQIVDTEPHVVLELGTRGVLPCRIQRRGYSVEWKRQVASESGLIVSLHLFSVGKRYGPGYEAGMFNITDDYSLVIKDVKVQDEGIYICSFYDYQTGITFRNSTRVSVQGVGTAEQIVDTEPHVVLELGTRGVLPCRIQRRGYSVEWKRQLLSGTELLVSLDQYFKVGERDGPGYEAGLFNITDDYSLVIKDVKVQDERIYICSFSDYQTGITFRNSTRVSVQEEENRMDGNTTIPNTMTGVTRDSDLFVFEDYNQRTAIATILFIVFLVGSVGNTIVITAVLFSHKLRSTTKTNWFVVNLGCADLLTCLAIPLNIVAMLSREGWPLPGWICSANAAVIMICLGASVMTLALIAYNRFYLLTRPKECFQKLYRTRNVCVMVLSAWLYPAILVLVPHFAGLGRLGYSYEYKACTQDTSLPTSDWYSLIAAAGLGIPVFIAIAIIYLRIYLFVSRQSKKMNQIKKSDESQPGGIGKINPEVSSSFTPSTEPNTFVLAIVVLAFLVSLFPFGMSVLVVVPASDPGIPWTGLMLTFNSCVNPFIYARTMPDFREVMASVICCCIKDIPEPVALIRPRRCVNETNHSH